LKNIAQGFPKFRVFFIFILAQILAAGEVKAVTFENLLQTTLKNNPNIKLSLLEIDTANANLDLAKSNMYPQIYLSANTEYSKRFDDAQGSVYIGQDSLSSSTNYANSASIIIRYDLYKFGSDTLNIKASQKGVLSQTHKVCNDKTGIALKLLDIYYQILSDREKLNNLTKLRGLYAQISNSNSRLNAAGEIDKVSLNNAKISVANLDKEIIQTKENIANLLSNLKVITGLNLSTNSLGELNSKNEYIKYANSKEFKRASKNLNMPKFEQTSLAQELQNKIAQNELELEAIKKEKYPTISAYARYDFYGSDRDDYWEAGRQTKRHGYRVGLTLSVPIFDGGRQKAKESLKRTELEKSKLQMQIAKSQYENEIETMRNFADANAKHKGALQQISSNQKEIANMQARLNQSEEASKIDVLNALIGSVQSEAELKEYILLTKYNDAKMGIYQMYGECR